MSFGFSIGDFLAVGTLIKDICHCLKDSKGSAAEYQELLRELDCLQKALYHLDKLKDGSSSQSFNLDSIKYAALSCRYPLEHFLRKIQKYDNSLGICRKDGAMKSAMNKLRWGFNEKEEVAKLQSYINIHIGTINILLAEHGLEKLILATEKADTDQLDIRERLSETNDIVKQCKGSLIAQTMVVQNIQGMLARLCKMINGEFRTSWKVMEDMVAKVCVSTQQIYTVLVEIKTSLPGPDTRWTFFQAPFLVEDTFGCRFPVPSEYDFGLLDAVVKYKFSNGPGSTEVQNGDYEYFKTKDSSSVICSASRLLPGMAITMAVVIIRPTLATEICPTLGCGSLNTARVPNGGRTCSECNVWFTATDRKLKSLNNLAIASSTMASSTMSSVSVAEFQTDNSTDSRKCAASQPAKEDEPVFKNIRLSASETTVKSPDSSTAISKLSTSLDSYTSPESPIGSISLDDSHPYLVDVGSTGGEKLGKTQKTHAGNPEEEKKSISLNNLLAQQTVSNSDNKPDIAAGSHGFTYPSCSRSFSPERGVHQRSWDYCQCGEGPKSRRTFQQKCSDCGLKIAFPVNIMV